MEAAAGALALVMAGVFLWAGVEKLRDLESFGNVVRALGLPARPVAGVPLAVAELGVGLGLVWAPGSVYVVAAVGLLAAIFAAAGLMALRGGKRIACHCLGALGNGRLGRVQVVALPVWLASAGLVYQAAPADRTVSQMLPLLAAVTVTMAALRTIGVGLAAWQARGDRLSAAQMFHWLR